MMKRMIAVAGLAVLILAGGVRAADAHVGLSIGIGIPGIVFGAPVYAAPAYYPSYPYGHGYGCNGGPAYYYGPPVVGGVYVGGRFGHGGGFPRRHFGGGRHWSDGRRGWR
jgi:hypothetical protein